jgi:hypothetical protein
MTGAVVIKWGSGVPGREAKGLEVFGRAVERFEGLAKQGRIHSHHEYFALSGPESGFMVVQGEIAELQKIMVEPETIQLNSQAAAIVQGFEIQLYAGGSDQSVQETMGNYMTGLSEIGYL